MKTLSVIALCLLLSACGGGEDEATATSYVATLNAACAQSGGTVASDGKQNCDYTASISYTVGANVDSADTTTLANNTAANGKTTDDCEHAAEVANLQCQLDRVSSGTSCSSLATGVAQALTTATSTSTEAGTTLVNTLLGAASSATTDAGCADAFKNAYLTYFTAIEGKLANSREGCAILSTYVTKILSKYQSLVDAKGAAALMGLAQSYGASVSGCPANTLMKLLYGALGSSSSTTASAVPASKTVTTTTKSTPRLRYEDFPLVY